MYIHIYTHAWDHLLTLEWHREDEHGLCALEKCEHIYMHISLHIYAYIYIYTYMYVCIQLCVDFLWGSSVNV